jgi:hypothetical protein
MTRNLGLWQLLSRSLSAGLSHPANKRLFPYFWCYIGWLSILSAIVPSLSFVESLGGIVFFVVMTSLLTHDYETNWTHPSGRDTIYRSINVLITSIMGIIIILPLLLLLVVPGVIASKQLIYSGAIAAKEDIGPIQALKASRQISKQNGYQLLGCILLLTPLMVSLAYPEILLGPLSFSVEINPILLKVILNVAFAWLSYVVINYMIIFSYQESVSNS